MLDVEERARKDKAANQNAVQTMIITYILTRLVTLLRSLVVKTDGGRKVLEKLQNTNFVTTLQQLSVCIVIPFVVC